MKPRSEQQTCPICLGIHARLLATSRYDCKTKICPDCGLAEACNPMLILMARQAGMGFPSYAGRMRMHGLRSEQVLGLIRLAKRLRRPPRAPKRR
jgi:hypothetical protein